ncbi:MAG: ribonuclease Y [Candidatus Komeilibacteria bacterium]|nr:ribonuclease Y [Candidatus Komeilibacteria bacterium]
MYYIVELGLLTGGLIVGLILGYFIKKILLKDVLSRSEKKAHTLLEDAKDKQREYLLEAKNTALQIIEDAKIEEKERRREMQDMQGRIEKRESMFDNKILEFESKQQKLSEHMEKLEAAKEEVKKIKEQQVAKLESVAQLSQQEAKDLLLHNVETSMKDELLGRIRKLENQASEDLEQRAKNMLAQVMQRVASSHTAESTTTIVTIPNEEMKGRIIGREGRNIKTVENLTGVEIIVDDTPDSIMVSGFSPIRRHLAKRVLDKLIVDGRIHPARIEEVVAQSKKELAMDIIKAGEDAAYEAGVVGLDPKLIQILGRLKYRTSYGQNQLRHALEVSHVSSMLAHELGANVAVCKKGGLLHDIGKALDHEVQGGHPEIGYDLMKKFGLPEEVAYMAIAHHEDQPKTIEGIIVKCGDAISGSRPGARKDSYENYIQRLEELEGVANSFEGIEKSYAIQAGREIRVFVTPEKIDDYSAKKLARDIANKIEAELKYPGEVKVTLIREMRITEYAR